MAIEYMRVSLQGSLPGGEVWSVNPCFQGDFTDAGPTHASLQAWATAIAVGLGSIVPSDLKAILSTAASITGVRVNYYGADGKLADYATAQPTTPLSGTGTLSQPPTTAVALSLYTANQTRQGRGRIFWPALALNLNSSTGRLQAATTSGLAVAAASMLEQLVSNAPSALNADLIVHSITGGGSFPVTSIRVGDVPDSQRGRKSALLEAYAITAFPPA